VVAAATVLSAGLTAVWWFGSEMPQPFARDEQAGRGTTAGPAVDPPDPANGYVGSAACARCHQEIAEVWKSHPMAQSIQPVSSFMPLPGSDRGAGSDRAASNRVTGRQRVYDVEFAGGKMVHHERMFDAAGQPIYDFAVPMEYAVGSGRRAKAFLYHRGDLLFMSPLNWYSPVRRWDFAPGYRGDDPRRFDRRVTEECLSCHAGRVATSEPGRQTFRRPAFHEMSIGCENCHGPGERHIAWHDATSGRTGTDPIVNPKRLDPAARESVCYQCHLQATVRLPRDGHTDLDFRPGMVLSDVWAILDAGSDVSEDGQTRAVNHVQQMRESRCYQQSGERMGCVSCHDPHRVPAVAEQAGFYRAKCLVCHAEADCSEPSEQRRIERDSCIACHMPAREASNVAHVSQTDHRIIRRPDRADDSLPAAADELRFFDGLPQNWSDREQQRALALGALKYLSKKGRPAGPEMARVLAPLLDDNPSDGTVLTALGSLALTHGRTELARSYFEPARQIRSSEEAALSGLLECHYQERNWNEALEAADSLLKIDPGDVRAQSLRTFILSELHHSDEAIAAAQRALELNPALLPVREWLSAAWRQAGEIEKHQEQEQMIQRLRRARPPD